MAARAALGIERDDARLLVTMPPSGNRWIIGLGLFAGIPWLLAFGVGSVVLVSITPPQLRSDALLVAFAANVLFLIAHILAVAGVWLALYNLRGSETLLIEQDRITVARRAVGITVPMRLGRTPDARVALLDLSSAPGKGPHQRLEVRSAGSAMRFGAGLSAEQAREVQSVSSEGLRTLVR